MLHGTTIVLGQRHAARVQVGLASRPEGCFWGQKDAYVGSTSPVPPAVLTLRACRQLQQGRPMGSPHPHLSHCALFGGCWTWSQGEQAATRLSMLCSSQVMSLSHAQGLWYWDSCLAQAQGTQWGCRRHLVTCVSRQEVAGRTINLLSMPWPLWSVICWCLLEHCPWQTHPSSPHAPPHASSGEEVIQLYGSHPEGRVGGQA